MITAGVASASTAPALTGWIQTGTSTVVSLVGGEGIATAANGSVHYAGSGTMPLKERTENWTHIGDPDLAQGYRFDAYQNSSSTAGSKMYLVTTPSGASYEYTHSLLAGEVYNNSFDTISPDGQWMVSGEWNDMNRLLVFPTPVLNSATPKTGGTLTAAGQITLDHPVRDIQGCDFVNTTRLLCTSDDPNTDLFPTPKQLLQVDLPAPPSGAPVTGNVTSLGADEKQVQRHIRDRGNRLLRADPDAAGRGHPAADLRRSRDDRLQVPARILIFRTANVTLVHSKRTNVTFAHNEFQSWPR